MHSPNGKIVVGGHQTPIYLYYVHDYVIKLNGALNECQCEGRTKKWLPKWWPLATIILNPHTKKTGNKETALFCKIDKQEKNITSSTNMASRDWEAFRDANYWWKVKVLENNFSLLNSLKKARRPNQFFHWAINCNREMAPMGCISFYTLQAIYLNSHKLSR